MVNSYSIRNIIFVVLLAGFSVSCTSSEKLLQRGQYDRAIDRAAEKLQRSPNDSKEFEVLKEAFYLANTFDNDRIEYLQLEGRDDNWVEILHLYEKLNSRQNVVRRLPSQIRGQFDFINYNEKIVEAKSEAASVSYERGVELLSRGDRISARQAYAEFRRVQEIYPGFLEVDDKIHESINTGTNNVLFQVENNSNKILPDQFEAEMRRIALKELNTDWLNFDTYDDPNQVYDFYVVLNIKGISISPERMEVNRFEETKEVKDGEQVKRDSRGNAVRDSLGNDIKESNMVTVSAQVVETVQSKSALVSGSIDFFDLRTDQLVRTDNMSVENVFKHHTAVAIGDERALSEETASHLDRDTVPFPSDEALLLSSVELLKDRSKSVIAANRRMLER